MVLFGSPTRFGNVSAQLKQFMDTLRIRHPSAASAVTRDAWTLTSVCHSAARFLCFSLPRDILREGEAYVAWNASGAVRDSHCRRRKTQAQRDADARCEK